MKLLADECCNVALVAALRSDGHDVLYAVESLRGATDDEVLMRADADGRILLTEDKAFGELVYRLKQPTQGIILLRFDVTEHALKISRLLSLLEKQPDQLPGSFVVLDKEKIHFRQIQHKR